ncbi:MAG TPA: hypothetical protein VGO55_07955 [Allosphingosinicella sp.]|jgi:hypothetical protein|nr:hypothetical protein [Allosphingosinicella sp.]
MSGRDTLDGDRGEPDEVYPPGERYQPHPPINWRAQIFTIALTIAILAVLDITGLREVLNRYVPSWAWGLMLVAIGLLGLLGILRSRAGASRAGVIVSGSLLMLLGAYLFIHFLP